MFQRLSLLCQGNVQPSFIRFGTNPVYKSLLFQPFQKRCKRSRIQMYDLSQILFCHTPVLPEYHHNHILRIGQVQLLQRFSVLTDNFLHAGIQRETYLIVQPQAIIDMARLFMVC